MVRYSRRKETFLKTSSSHETKLAYNPGNEGKVLGEGSQWRHRKTNERIIRLWKEQWAGQKQWFSSRNISVPIMCTVTATKVQSTVKGQACRLWGSCERANGFLLK